MYYCTNCHRVTPERTESCPYCNKFDRLRPAEEADECRLTELDALNASVMESLLKEANVPYIARPMMGAGISAALGVTLEKFVFFVAYRDGSSCSSTFFLRSFRAFFCLYDSITHTFRQGLRQNQRIGEFLCKMNCISAGMRL